MPTLKPLYGGKTAITITLNSLANGSVATSSAVDNSADLFSDTLIEVTIAGTAAANAFCSVVLLPSLDNSVFATYESGIPLGSIILSATPQTGQFSVIPNLMQATKYWKIAVKNQTGAALSASGNSASYQGVNIQQV